MLYDLVKQIEGINLFIAKDDEWLWRDDETQGYTVKSAYKMLMSENSAHGGFRYDVFWRTKGLPSAQFFAWRVLINKVLTRDNLYNRGVRLGSNTCALCEITDETVSHLFFTCKVATRI